MNRTLDIAASALNVFGVDMQVAAHNIANVSTAGFQPQRATHADRPDGGGVMLESVLQGGRPARPGGRPAPMGSSLTRPELDPEERETVFLDPLPEDIRTNGITWDNAALRGAVEAMAARSPLPDPPSGTDPARELVSMTMTERAFEANAAAVRAADDMMGDLLNLKA